MMKEVSTRFPRDEKGAWEFQLDFSRSDEQLKDVLVNVQAILIERAHL